MSRQSFAFFADLPENDAVDLVDLLGFYVNGVYVKTTGDLVVTDQLGREVTFSATVPGTVIPIAPRRCMVASSGTYAALGNVPRTT